MGRDVDAQHAVLALPIDGGRIADHDLLSLRGHQPNGPDLFGDQHAAIGQEGHPPGQSKGGHRGHLEGQAGFGLLFAHIDLGPGRRRRQGEEHQRRFRQFHRHFSLFLLATQAPDLERSSASLPAVSHHGARALVNSSTSTRSLKARQARRQVAATKALPVAHRLESEADFWLICTLSSGRSGVWRVGPDNNVGPPCPTCHSAETERLPFTSDAAQVPVYSCVECGDVRGTTSCCAHISVTACVKTRTRSPGNIAISRSSNGMTRSGLTSTSCCRMSTIRPALALTSVSVGCGWDSSAGSSRLGTELILSVHCSCLIALAFEGCSADRAVALAVASASTRGNQLPRYVRY